MLMTWCCQRTLRKVLQKCSKTNSAVELRGMKVNIGKTKLLTSGKISREATSSGQYPCAVCNHAVGVNTIFCTRSTKSI